MKRGAKKPDTTPSPLEWTPPPSVSSGALRTVADRFVREVMSKRPEEAAAVSVAALVQCSRGVFEDFTALVRHRRGMAHGFENEKPDLAKMGGASLAINGGDRLDVNVLAIGGRPTIQIASAFSTLVVQPVAPNKVTVASAHREPSPPTSPPRRRSAR